MRKVVLASILAVFAGAVPVLAANMIAADGIKVTGKSVTVGSVSADKTGWLVVHQADESGTPGPVIGHTMVKKGSSKNVSIDLDNEVPSGSKLVIMLHEEGDNDTDFDDADKPVTSGRGPIEQVVTVE